MNKSFLYYIKAGAGFALGATLMSIVLGAGTILGAIGLTSGGTKPPAEKDK